MKRRLNLSLALVVLAGVASAQVPPPTEDSIVSAFATLRSQPDLYVRLDGQQIINGATYDALSELYFHQVVVGGQTLAKVEVQRKFKRPTDTGYTIFQRVVGDGFSLYDYRPTAYEFTAINYGDYNAPVRTAEEQARYVKRLIAMVVHAVGDTEALTVRVLREIYGGDQASFHRWIPQVEPQISANAITYDLGSPATRSYTFQFDTTNTTITGISAFDARRTGTGVRTGTYNLFVTNVLPTSGLFVPFSRAITRNWRIVADSRGTNF
jgi:hypothetical protein